jgi:SepF-like predicted cell division protein (DUF552 family)
MLPPEEKSMNGKLDKLLSKSPELKALKATIQKLPVSATEEEREAQRKQRRLLLAKLVEMGVLRKKQ